MGLKLMYGLRQAAAVTQLTLPSASAPQNGLGVSGEASRRCPAVRVMACVCEWHRPGWVQMSTVRQFVVRKVWRRVSCPPSGPRSCSSSPGTPAYPKQQQRTLP